MRAWWAYWMTFALGAALWIGVAIASPSGGIREALHLFRWAGEEAFLVNLGSHEVY